MKPLYTRDPDTLEEKPVNIAKLRGLGVLVFAILLCVNAFTTKKIYEEVVTVQVDTTFIEKYDVFEHIKLYKEINSENPDAFILQTKSIGVRLGIPFEHLLTLFYLESGINHKAKNTKYPFDDGTCAYGLIQFTPVVRKAMNISYTELQALNEFEQLELVYDYFNKNKDKIESFSDLYLLTYLPAYIGKPDKTPIPSKYYNDNPTLGKSLGEFRKIVNEKFNKLQ